jgi:threonine/homoserine/homoserine lactone efflux protein
VIDLSTFVAFLVAVLAYQLVPGPDTFLVVSRGLGEGRTIAAWTAVGAVAAGAVQLPLLAGGVASLVSSSEVLFRALQLVGAAYLVWLGVKLIVERRASASGRSISNHPGAAAAFRDGLISNLTNPNSLVFMLAFQPQFVDPAKGRVGLQLLLLGSVQKLSGLLMLGATAMAAGTLGNRIATYPASIAWQKTFAGLVMIGLGLRLLFTGDPRHLRS